MVRMHKGAPTLLELVKAFELSVLNYSAAVLEDSRAANRHYDGFIEALKRIAAHGEEGLTALALLLDDNRIVVRVTAACYLVHFRPERAIRVLEEASRLENRAIAMLAFATKMRWEKGIYLDPATGKESKLPGR